MARLGKVCRSASCVDRRRWRTASGSVATVHVPRACALVRSDGRTKVRKGCRLTKSGAVCDEATKLPDSVQVRKGKTRKSKKYTIRCG